MPQDKFRLKKPIMYKSIPKHQTGDRLLYTGVKEFVDKVHVNDDGTVTTPSGTTGNVVLPTITVKP